MSQTPSRPALTIQKPVEVRPDAGAPNAPARRTNDPAGVFLSPRVVDQQAFDDFSERLRTIIAEAGETGNAVGVALDELKSLREEGTSAVQRQKSLIEAGAKLVKAVEAKQARLDTLASRADALLTSLSDSTARAETASADLDERLERVIEQRMQALETRMDERIRALTDEIESKLQQRVSDMAFTLQSIDSTREDLEAIVRDATENTLVALREANERGARLAGWDPADIVDGAGLGQPARDSLADLILRAEALQERTLGATSQLARLRDEASILLERIPQQLHSTREDLAQLDEDRADIDGRITDARHEVERLDASAQPVLRIQERAEKTAADLAQLLVQSRTLRDEEKTAESRLRDAIDRAEKTLDTLTPWRDVCFASATDAERATLPPVLEAITRRFQSSLTRDIEAMADALQRVARRDVTQS